MPRSLFVCLFFPFFLTNLSFGWWHLVEAGWFPNFSAPFALSLFWEKWLIHLVILFVILCQVYYVGSSVENQTQLHNNLTFWPSLWTIDFKVLFFFCLLQLPPTHISTCFVPHLPGWVCSWQCVGGYSTSNHLLPGCFSRMHTQNYCYGWCCQGYLQQISGCRISIPYKQGSCWTVH